MKGNSVFKVPDGKLVKVSLDFDDKINTIRITGDFFVYPEESIESLEKELAGAALDEARLSGIINDFFIKNNVEVFGIGPDSLAKAIIMCRCGVQK